MAHASARALALAALHEWQRGRRFADSILQDLLSKSVLSGSDRAFATELFYGVLRNLTVLDFWIGQLRSGSLDDRSRDLLRLGLYQLFYLHTAGHAAVFETVALAPQTGRSLVNAILRSATRRDAELQAAAEAQSLAVRSSHPEFLVEKWIAAFGSAAASSLCEWDNQPAPVYARINTLKITVADFVANVPGCEPLTGKSDFVRLGAIPHQALERGECYIQDPSTSVACELLAPLPGETVLDACAAPGGKTSLLAQLMANHGELIACDRHPMRLGLLTGNLGRLGVSIAHVIRQDWTSDALSPELRGRHSDRILLDAPCTNTGVIRRRVDVRWRLKAQDFARMPEEQLRIARAVLPLLKIGGALVYSTCSIAYEENTGVVRRLLEEFPNLRLEEERSVLPFHDHFDGAYAAKLIRTA